MDWSKNDTLPSLGGKPGTRGEMPRMRGLAPLTSSHFMKSDEQELVLEAPWEVAQVFNLGTNSYMLEGYHSHLLHPSSSNSWKSSNSRLPQAPETQALSILDR